MSQGDVFACEIDNKIVAAVAGYTKGSDDGLAYISIAGTTNECQQCGLMKLLATQFLDLARSRDCKGVHLYAVGSNKPACIALERLGFTRSFFSNEKRPEDVHFLLRFDKRILVTSIGSFSALRTIRSLKNAGYYVVGCDINTPELVAASCEVDEFYQVPLSSNQIAYMSSIEEIVRNENIKYVIPLTDLEVDVLERSRTKLEAELALWNSDYVRVCRNKLQLSNKMSDILGSHYILTLRADSAVFENLTFPIICKPINGRSSQGIYVAENYSGFLSWSKTVDLTEFIIQPFLQGKVVTVDVVRNAADNQVVCMPRREHVRTPNGAGLVVELFHNDRLHHLCATLARRIELNGCINFEFIETEEGTFYFLECNPRFSGGIAFSHTAGYDFILNHMKCFQGLAIDPQPIIPNEFIAKQYQEVITKIL